MIGVQAEVRSAFERLRDRLGAESAVAGLWSQEEDGELHGWVLIRHWDVSARYAVYQTQFEADPELLVKLHLTDREAEIPEDAQAQFRR